MADDRLLIPDPAVSRYTTSTSPAPSRLRWNAVDAPATPAPTTITSALIRCLPWVRCGRWVRYVPWARCARCASGGFSDAAPGPSRGPPPSRLPVPAQVGQDPVRRVVAGRAGDSATRVGALAAQVQAADRS